MTTEHTPDSSHRIPDIKDRRVEAGYQMSHSRGQRLENRDELPETYITDHIPATSVQGNITLPRNQRPEIGNQKQGIRKQRQKFTDHTIMIGYWKPETSNKRPETRYRIPKARD